MSNYRYFIIQTYKNLGEPSNKAVRARALPNQGVAIDRKVSCSGGMRLSHPAGTYFKVRCKVTDRQGGTPYLYRHHTWDYEVVSHELAEAFIKDKANE